MTDDSHDLSQPAPKVGSLLSDLVECDTAYLKGKVISAPTCLQSGVIDTVRYLEYEKEFRAHIWADCSTHEHNITSKYEVQTCTELGDRWDFVFGL